MSAGEVDAVGIVTWALVHYKFDHVPDHHHQPKKASQEHPKCALRSGAIDHIHTEQRVGPAISFRLVQG